MGLTPSNGQTVSHYGLKGRVIRRDADHVESHIGVVLGLLPRSAVDAALFARSHGGLKDSRNGFI